jgi:PBP1b-binding outer membrane lipoprotein LpoB
MLKHAAVALTLALLPACASTEVQYGDSTATESVDENLGLTDVQQTAENMKNELAGFNFPDADKDPVDGRVRLRVLTVANDTSEHFDEKILTDKIRKVMLSSGKIVCVAEKESIADLHKERAYGDAMAQGTSAPKEGRVKFGRYALVGRVKSITKRNADVKLRDYIFTLDLVNTESEEILLTAEKEIRKVKNR